MYLQPLRLQDVSRQCQHQLRGLDAFLVIYLLLIVSDTFLLIWEFSHKQFIISIFAPHSPQKQCFSLPTSQLHFLFVLTWFDFFFKLTRSDLFCPSTHGFGTISWSKMGLPRATLPLAAISCQQLLGKGWRLMRPSLVCVRMMTDLISSRS